MHSIRPSTAPRHPRPPAALHGRSGHIGRAAFRALGAGLLATVACVSALSAPPPPDAAENPTPATLGREVVEHVETRFFDPERAARWADDHRDYAAEITDPDAFRRATREALARLGASHTEYYTPRDPGYYGLLAVFESYLKVDPTIEDLGLGLVRRQTGWHVGRVFPGGPGEAAGLQRGDLLVEVDGRPFEPIESLRGRAGEALVLSVRRQARGGLFRVAIRPRRAHPKTEWLRAQEAGSRLLAGPEAGLPEGVSVAYAPLWSCAGREHLHALREKLTGELAAADALILDFRDGWGGCPGELVSLFDDAVPRLESIDRDGVARVYEAAWRKPAFVLINRGSRSGKEMVARSLQRHGLATLVGERTAGAVVAGTPILLADRSLLYLAVADVRIDGERLEGKGVHPDLAVVDDLPFAAGRDRQLEAALAAAVRAIRGTEAGL